VGGDVGKLRAQAPVDGKAGGDDQEVQHEHALGGVHVQLVAHGFHALHRTTQVEVGVGMARHAQGAALRGGHLLGVDVVADAPFPVIGQQVLAVGQAGHARALGLVDARQVAAAHQQVHAGGAQLQGRAGTVHGRGARAHHAHMPAGQRGVVQGIGRVGPEAAIDAVHEGRHLRATQAVAAGGQHQAAREPGAGVAVGAHVQGHQAIGLGSHGEHLVRVAHIGAGDAAVPAQVVHPLQARNLVEGGPGLQAELRDEPGAEAQRRNAQRRPGQLLGRAQGLHARRGGPGAFEIAR